MDNRQKELVKIINEISDKYSIDEINNATVYCNYERKIKNSLIQLSIIEGWEDGSVKDEAESYYRCNVERYRKAQKCHLF